MADGAVQIVASMEVDNPLARTTNGLVFRDQFNRADSSSVGNGWTMFNGGVLSIQSNTLRFFGDAKVHRSSPAEPDSFIVQANTQFLSSVISVVSARSDITGLTGYVVEIAEFSWSLRKYLDDAVLIQDVVAHTLPLGSWHTHRLVIEESGPDVLARLYNAASILGGTDLSKEVVLKASFTDNSPLSKVSPVNQYFLGQFGTGDHKQDEFFLCGRNIVVSGLETGQKVQLDSRTAIVESGGSVTIDVDTFALPATTIKVLNADDNVLATLTPSDGIWGGDIYTADVVEILGEVQVAASVQVQFSGQVQIDGSMEVASSEQVQVDVSTEVKQNSQIQIAASFDADQNGVVQASASVEISQNSAEQFNASMEVALIGQVEIDASSIVAQNGEAQVTASTEVSQNGVVVVTASMEVTQTGEVFADASLAAKFQDEVQVDASVVADQNGAVQVVASLVTQIPSEVQVDASVEAVFSGNVQIPVFVGVLQNAQNGAVGVDASSVVQVPSQVQVNASIRIQSKGQVRVDASINAAQNGIIPFILSISVAQNGVIQAAASIASDIGGRVQVDASTNVAQNGTVNVAALIGVLQRIYGQVTVDSSINALQKNQIQVVASVQAISLGAVQEVVSIVVSQNAQVTVPVSISVLQAGGEVQIVASISVQENAQVFVNASVQAQAFVFLDGEVQTVASVQIDFHVGLEDRSGAVKHAYIPNSGRFVLRGDTLFIVDNETLRRQQKPAEGFGWDLDLFSNPPGELIVDTNKPGSVPLQYKIDRDGGEFDMGVLRIEIPDDWPKV